MPSMSRYQFFQFSSRARALRDFIRFCLSLSVHFVFDEVLKKSILLRTQRFSAFVSRPIRIVSLSLLPSLSLSSLFFALPFSASFSASPLLDSTEIIDRVHYARTSCTDIYLHSRALLQRGARAPPYLFFVS